MKKSIDWTAVRAFRKPYVNFMNEMGKAYDADMEMGHGYVSEHLWADMQNDEVDLAEPIAKRFGLTGYELIQMNMWANEICDHMQWERAQGGSL